MEWGWDEWDRFADAVFVLVQVLDFDEEGEEEDEESSGVEGGGFGEEDEEETMDLEVGADGSQEEM